MTNLADKIDALADRIDYACRGAEKIPGAMPAVSFTVEEWAQLTRALRAEARMREALVQHNDRLRSAQQIASREGADTNWKSFRGAVTYTLAEYHELVNECRQALGDNT